MNELRVTQNRKKSETGCRSIIVLASHLAGYGDRIIIASFLLLSFAQKSAAQQHFVDETSFRLPEIDDVTVAAWFADLKGDGDLDLLVENRLDGLNPSYVIMNDGTGHFPLDSMRTIINGVHRFTFGDFGDVDNDGDWDVIFSNGGGADTENSRIFINDGKGYYTDETESRFPTNYPVNDSPQTVFLDCDNDMDLDALFAVLGWEILLMNIGNGFYDWDYDHRFPRNSDDSFSIAEGDVDGDFDIDVLIGNDGGDLNKIYINYDGYFIDETEERWFTIPHYTSGICLADIDSDGDLDLMASYGGFSVDYGIFINDGAGFFADETESRIPLYGVTCTGIFSADVDNDGDFDILVTTDVRLGIQMTSRLFINNGDGYFSDETDQRFPSAEDMAYHASFGDVDNDDDSDLLVCNADYSDPFEPVGMQNRLLINMSSPDSILPVIAKTLNYPDTGDTTNVYIISTLAWDNISVAPGELRLSLQYKKETGDFTELVMYDCGGFIYRRDIPAQPAGTKVEYYVKAEDKRGNISLDPQNAPDSVYSFMVTATGIEKSDPESKLPLSFSLSQNFPNPFNPTTEILYTIPEKEREGVGVTVFIYNVRGQLMRSFKEGKKLPGSYRIVWDGKGDSGVKVSSGVYFYRMHAGDYITTRKMVMAK